MAEGGFNSLGAFLSIEFSEAMRQFYAEGGLECLDAIFATEEPNNALLNLSPMSTQCSLFLAEENDRCLSLSADFDENVIQVYVDGVLIEKGQTFQTAVNWANYQVISSDPNPDDSSSKAVTITYQQTDCNDDSLIGLWCARFQDLTHDNAPGKILSGTCSEWSDYLRIYKDAIGTAKASAFLGYCEDETAVGAPVNQVAGELHFNFGAGSFHRPEGCNGREFVFDLVKDGRDLIGSYDGSGMVNVIYQKASNDPCAVAQFTRNDVGGFIPGPCE